MNSNLPEINKEKTTTVYTANKKGYFNPHNVPYKKLNISYPIPEELEKAIDDFMICINERDGDCENCYRTEIDCEIRFCIRERILSDDQCQELKDYYVHRGIYKYSDENKNKES